MKKISKFFKCTMLSILSLCMAFGVIFNVKDGNALRVNADTTSKVYSTDYYTISYADNELKILLSTSLSEYQDFSKDELNDLKNAIVSVGYSAILDDINFDLGDATASGLKNSRRHYASEQASEGYTYDISLITNVIKSQLSGSSNTEAALDDALGLDPITGEIAGAGTYDNLLEFYVNRYVETKTSEVEESSKEQEKEVAYAEISEQLTKAIQEVVDSTENYVIEEGTVASKVESIINNAKEEVVLEDLGAVTEVVNLIQNEKTEEGKSVIVEVIEQTQISNEVKDIIVEAKSDDVVNFIENLEASTIIDVVGSVKLDKEEIKTVINNVGVENLLPAINNKDFNKEQIDDLKEVVKDSGLTKDDIQEIVNENVSNISIVTLLTAIKTIKIDGHELYNGKELVLGGLEAVIRSFPKPAEIANYTDDQMNLTWNLEVGTTFGSVEFDFTVGFKGDCSRIRQAASYAADYVNFDIADGVVNVEVLAPGKLSDVMLRLSNTGRVSDDLKLDIFNNAFATVEEVYGKVTDRTYEDYLNVLKKVDYQMIVDNVYNAENLNRIFHTDKFTDARLDNFVDDVKTLISKASNITYDRVKSFVGKYYDISKLDNTAVETLINKAHDCLVKIDSLTFDSALLREFIDPNSEYSNDNIDEYIDKLERFEPQFNTAMDLLERAYNAAPDRFKDNSVMDFYKGDGTFNYAGAFNLDIEKWLNKASSKYGDEVYDALNVVFDKLPQQIDVNFTLNLTDIHSVTYNIGSEVKVGMLPAGANVELYANTTEIEGYEVFGWQDINGVQYTEMPNHDVELFPVIHSFEVAINEGVDKVYDAQAHELVVTTTPVGNGFAYQWYKDGALIEGATEATYSVVNVADSGEYYCTVSYFGKEKETDTVSVNISQAEIDVAEWSWDYVEPFTYAEGTTHEVHVVVPEAYADLVDVTEAENAKEAAGEYTATATVESANANYVVVGTIANLTWVIVMPEAPEYSYTYNYDEVDREYDGTVTTIEVTVTSTVEGDQFTATYQWYKDEKVLVGSTANTISVAEVADTGTYYCLVTVNGTALEKETIEVVIHPMTLDVTSITLKPGTSFEYTGEEITVELDYPAALDTYLDINPSLTESQMSATEAGTYYVDVIINVKEDLDEENFDINLDGLTLPYIGDGIDNIIRLTWEIKEGGVTPPPAETKSEFTYSEGGITLTVTIKSGTPIDATFELDVVAKNAADYTSEFGTVLAVYDILFMDGNQVATLPSGNTYEVTLTLDATTAAKSGLFVIYFPDDASAAQEKLDATVANGKITFTTTHFSVYGVAEPEQDPIIPGPGPSDEPTMEPTVEPSDQPSGDQPGTDKPVEPSEQPSWWVWVLLVLSGIIIALLLVLILRKREPVVVPVVAEPTAAEVSYIVVNENGVELVKLGEAQADDILSDVPTNEHTIGTVADDKVTIFKSARQLRTAIGKIKDYNGNLSILVHKEPYKVVEKIVVDRGAQAINEETVHVEVGQIAENNEKVIVKIFKNPKNVD